MPWSEQGLEKEKCLAAARLFVRTVLPFFVLETAVEGKQPGENAFSSLPP